MPPQKRKRPHDTVAPETSPQAPPRRATRQHPLAGPEPKHQLRSGRKRVSITEELPAASVELQAPRGRRNDAPKTTIAHDATVPPAKKQTRATRHSIAEHDPVEEAAASTTVSAIAASKENIKPSSPSEGEVGHRNLSISPLGHAQTLRVSPVRLPEARPISPTQVRHAPLLKTTQQSQTSRLAHPTAAPVASTPRRPASSPDKPPRPPPTPRSDRNVDKVVLGNVCFKAWYPSYYGKEVLGDLSNNHGNSGNGDAGKDGGKLGRIGGGKRATVPPPMLDRLYVCPCCFKYSRELVMWWEHVRTCERTFQMPGTKVYTHPKGTRTIRVPAATPPAAEHGVSVPVGGGKGKGKGKRGDVGGGVFTPVAMEEVVVSDEGEWSVWEVDGEKDRLFCQNLSLFAKLFLDNKSVFFDVTGFNYFLLVYTPPPPPPELFQNPPQTQSPPPPSAPTTTDSPSQPPAGPSSPTETGKEKPAVTKRRPQVVGFFSKEKLSWDNNNLACILVFPPWQRKGLGALLMGVSYEISRREGVLGGPEKPISELGRKGYRRFWAGEIARWILGLDMTPSPPPSPEADARKRRGDDAAEKEPDPEQEAGEDGDDEVEMIELGDRAEDERRKDGEGEREGGPNGGGAAKARGRRRTREVTVSVEQCSRATWIVPEDCLAVLREMGVVVATAAADERRGEEDTKEEEEDERVEAEEHEGKTRKTPTRTTAPRPPRVLLDREVVRRWVQANRVELTRTCDPHGFVEGWARRLP
ncbi:acyl-CoA N-acyltransferase [Durotheca rogersii]|uniref:acyl-CoA N-acyltransferase n=1 Tax=Durotheca rogersii TaxID=419775 RepID=UPI0022205EB9|nr:acyl-CoA N-acyltransferase [Durotheca rogersii]KAI5863640.1 acyl-CoA N-acyltransferase [Durotheca rogersii]